MSGFQTTLFSEGLTHGQTKMNLYNSSDYIRGFNKFAKTSKDTDKGKCHSENVFDQTNTLFPILI